MTTNRHPVEIKSTYSIDGLGAILKEARLNAQMTQEELAKKLGTKRSYISRIEKDASCIKLATLQRIVELGLDGRLSIDLII